MGEARPDSERDSLGDLGMPRDEVVDTASDVTESVKGIGAVSPNGRGAFHDMWEGRVVISLGKLILAGLMISRRKVAGALGVTGRSLPDNPFQGTVERAFFLFGLPPNVLGYVCSRASGKVKNPDGFQIGPSFG